MACDLLKARLRSAKYYAKHKQRIKEKRAATLGSKGDELRAKDRARYARNPEAILAAAKRWRDRNPNKVKLYSRTRAKKLRKATPKWVDMKAIEAVYIACPSGWHVDHIVPIQGKNVCGLHVPWNLQPMFPRDNISKGNKCTW